MPLFRKSKQPADIPVSTPVRPADLVQDLVLRRKSRVLAASSTAIALSIGSAFSDTTDTFSGGATARGTGWQTAYAAAKMAVETIKESSDLFPPLKAVVGAMSILIRSYDVSVSVLELSISSSFPPFLFQQTSDNVDGMKGVERRVQSLFSVFTSPVGDDDYAEKGRRMELRRFVISCTDMYQFMYPSIRKLEGVIAKLEPLADQHAFIGFLRNVDNAKILTGFIQELADAITDYQV